ncbi:hypothetical protein [Novisyntrophococcus fermenticellae]|uniref:hypothetical protein n=1 Tax=Novisyntrophococcus fermenticellae TaxID=2068655 RepID=UPI002E784477|nr:hypothetical protein [Novisyntrophococcus fermenticellae]
MRNDISFLIDSRLTMYEHQSTYNPNLPLRNLFYIADLYSNLTRDANLYGSKLIALPTPRFIVFYNGEELQPERQELKLSDAFQIPEGEPSLELKALMLNINKGHNVELMKRSKTLCDYAEYVSRIRSYQKSMPIADAVEKAITECIAEGILEDFLRRNRAEAKKMSIYEYNEEKVMQALREEAMEEGLEEGIERGREEGRKEGREEGRTRVNELIKKLAAAGRTDDIIRAVSDKGYQEQLFKEFGI